jgi:hypothetical protein
LEMTSSRLRLTRNVTAFLMNALLVSLVCRPVKMLCNSSGRVRRVQIGNHSGKAGRRLPAPDEVKHDPEPAEAGSGSVPFRLRFLLRRTFPSS